MLFLLRSSLLFRSSSRVLTAALVAVGLSMSSPARAEICMKQSDCSPGFCVHGFCCDTPCDAPCQTCRDFAKESGKMDGICGIIKIGTVCQGHCDGDTFSFVEGARCNEAGQCLGVPTESCTLDDPCKIDLCGDDGCEHLLKLEGQSCGGGKVCDKGGACIPDPSTSSSSGNGGAGGGSGGAGGAGGAGGSSITTSGGGSGTGTETASSSGVGGGYPPSHYSGCGCRTAEDGSAGGAAALGLAALALLRRRRA